MADDAAFRKKYVCFCWKQKVYCFLGYEKSNYDGFFTSFYSLMECYRRVAGPKFHELNVDGEKESSQAKILKAVLENIPTLNNSEKKQQVC